MKPQEIVKSGKHWRFKHLQGKPLPIVGIVCLGVAIWDFLPPTELATQILGGILIALSIFAFIIFIKNNRVSIPEWAKKDMENKQ